MTSIAARFTNAARRHADYRRTLAELRSMPTTTMADLGLTPADFPRLAREAIYGA